MSGRKLRSFSFLVFVLLLASSFIGCGDQGSSPSETPSPPPTGSWRGTQQWGTPFNDIGQGIARDSSANIYITGSTGGSLDNNTSSGQLDIFLTKFDSTGNKLFTRQIGTPYNDIGYAIAVDGSGNVYVTGSTGGSLPGNATAGQLDVFLAKFDSSGRLLFIQQFGTQQNDIGYGIALDSSGNVFITGSTGGSLPGNLSAGLTDIFLARLDPNGNLAIRQFGTPFEDISYAVALDSSGNVYITGTTGGNLDGNTSLGRSDVFLTKFDPNGIKLGSRQLGTTGDDTGFGLAVDSSGNVYITGSAGGITGTSVFSEIFLAKLDSSGILLFLQLLATPFVDIGYGVAVDSSANAFITGSTDGNLDGNTSAGLSDIFLAKFNSAGVKQ
jgi:Beta-propeller repeat